MTVWARAFLQPSSTISTTSSDGRLLRALALLLESRVDEYQRLAASVGLPLSVDEEQSPDAGVRRFAQALLAFSQGQADAMNHLAEVLAGKGGDPEVRAVAAILQGILLSGLGRPDWAIRALQGHIDQPTDSLTQALLLLHLGLRSVEAGRVKEGLAYTQDAERKVVGRRDSAAYTLRLVAADNAWQISWLVGQALPSPTLSFQRSELFASIFRGAEYALSTYLDETFTSYFEDPHSRTVKFAVEDSIDVGVSRALLRCESLAYRQGIIQYRRKLGRYRLLTEAGQAGPAVSTGFELLRRAGDDKGLKLAIRTFRASGPLEVLRTVGLRVAKGSWLEPELEATLEVIGATAFTFDFEAARSAFDRLMAAIPDIVTRRFGGAWLADSGFRALGGLLPLVDPPRTKRASEWLRQVAEAEPNPMIHQSMQSGLHALQWMQLDKSERNAWLGYVRKYLTSRDDRLFPARSAALELASTGVRQATAAIYAAYREGQSQWLAPLVVGMGELRDADRQQVALDVLQSARRMRENAHEGQFSLGGPGVGGLLARAASRFGNSDLFEEIGHFVLDDKVPLDERVTAVMVLLEDPAAVPKSLRRRLVGGLPEPIVNMPLFGDPTPLQMVNLRLRAAFGRLLGTDAVAILLRFANDPRPQLRASAAYSARELATRAPIPIGTLLLSLSHDPVPEVRGSAGRGLARIQIGTGDLDQTRQSRIIELIQEPGELVPIQVWFGIAEAARAGEVLNPEIARLAREVAAQHVAQTVRNAAADVLKIKLG